MKIDRRLTKRKKPVSKWKRFIKDITAFFTLTWSQLFIIVPLLYLTCTELNFREDIQLARESSFGDSSFLSFVAGEETPEEIFEYIDYPGTSMDFAVQNGRKPSSNISKKDILSDKDNRISPEFKIPEAIYKRTAFWYDVYTKYSNQHYVLHNKEYPWVIYKVVDVSSIMSEPSKNKWTKYHRAEKKIKEERAKIRNQLYSLSRKNPRKYTSDDLKIVEMLAEIPGKNRKKIFLDAAYNMRTQVGQKEFIEKGITESAQYLPHMENVFREQGLPVELTRMPFVESSFNTDAESKVGASGIWQFMPSTGKQFMKVGEHIDERNSPLKATVAASKLLKQYHKALGTWPLAVTAYNYGIGSLQDAVRKTKTTDISKIINTYRSRSFEFASPNFYPSFLAILHAERYHNEVYGTLEKNSILAFKEVRLKKDIRLSKLLRIIKMDFESFRYFNKDVNSSSFKLNLSLPRGFRLHLPDKLLEKYTEYEKSLEKSKSNNRVTIADKKKKES